MYVLGPYLVSSFSKVFYYRVIGFNKGYIIINDETKEILFKKKILYIRKIRALIKFKSNLFKNVILDPAFSVSLKYYKPIFNFNINIIAIN